MFAVFPISVHDSIFKIHVSGMSLARIHGGPVEESADARSLEYGNPYWCIASYGFVIALSNYY